MISLRIGIDLVCVDDVERSVRTHADHYLRRVYTSTEVEDCMRADGTVDAVRLAARFAAKEAVMKALHVGDEAVPWSSIGVRSDPDGAPALELTGAAASLARRRGIGALDLSMTHDGPVAGAVVVGVVEETAR